MPPGSFSYSCLHASHASAPWPCRRPAGVEQAAARVGVVVKGAVMDDVVNRLAREMVEAISSSVAADPRVEACREKGRAAGYEIQLSLEAVLGFASRGAGPLAEETSASAPPNKPEEISSNDRRFLRSLRIAVDETPKEVE